MKFFFFDTDRLIDTFDRFDPPPPPLEDILIYITV